jgi:hypothetical protein
MMELGTTRTLLPGLRLVENWRVTIGGRPRDLMKLDARLNIFLR